MFALPHRRRPLSDAFSVSVLFSWALTCSGCGLFLDGPDGPGSLRRADGSAPANRSDGGASCGSNDDCDCQGMTRCRDADRVGCVPAELVHRSGEDCHYRWASVAAGHAFTCGIDRRQRLYCFGLGAPGEAPGPDGLSRVPAPLALSGVPAGLMAGARFVAALDPDGRVWVFGSDPLVPPDNVLQVDAPVVALGAGEAFLCALTGDGRVYCLGDNARLQAGTEAGSFQPLPQEISLVRGAMSLGAGWDFACVVGGESTCWGSNEQRQLGLPDRAPYLPTRQPELQSLVALAGGRHHGCGVDGNGRAGCWGSPRIYDPATRTDVPLYPREAEGYDYIGIGLAGVRDLDVGESHACATTTAGVYCWGANTHGQVGPSSVPAGALHAVGASAERIATGARHSCALAADGRLRCWGDNRSLQTTPRGERLDHVAATEVLGPRWRAE